MDKNLTFTYDREGDILTISKRAPYAGQGSEELEDGIVARLDPKTGEIDSWEVLFFSTRLMRTELFELPGSVELDRAG